jgi:hypothetical protein
MRNTSTSSSTGLLTLRGTQPLTGFEEERKAGGLFQAAGTIFFNYTFPTIPTVVATVENSSTSTIYSICIYSISTSSFSYSKTLLVSPIAISQDDNSSFTWEAWSYQ